MPLKIAFAGFGHPHIFDLWKRCTLSPDVTIVGACEMDEGTCTEVARQHGIEITHRSFSSMLADTRCDIVAIGDRFGRRGQLVIAALEAGKHVISDKPICICPDELNHIEALCRRKSLCLGCMLDLRDSPMAFGMRDFLGRGRAGRVMAVHFNGMHPLNLGRRASWYFKPELHGGTLNDIAIHALDLIPWLTGESVTTLAYAQVRSLPLSSGISFQRSAQCLFNLTGGAACMGDVSYLSPDSFGYALPTYWEFRFWCENGLVSCAYNSKVIEFHENGKTSMEQIPLLEGRPGGYFSDFLSEVRGTRASLTTDAVITASRLALQLQARAIVL